mgnify:CR=1 FL=1
MVVLARYVGLPVHPATPIPGHCARDLQTLTATQVEAVIVTVAIPIWDFIARKIHRGLVPVKNPVHQAATTALVCVKSIANQAIPTPV